MCEGKRDGGFTTSPGLGRGEGKEPFEKHEGLSCIYLKRRNVRRVAKT